jgi:alpha-galactosidase
VRLQAENSRGRAAHTLEIVVGDTLALTPPMGWSSWYCMSGKVSDA